jgi:hypothetical protein
MNRIILGLEVVIESALFLEGGLSGWTILIAETFVGTDMNMELVVHVGIRSSDVSNAEID